MRFHFRLGRECYFNHRHPRIYRKCDGWHRKGHRWWRQHVQSSHQGTDDYINSNTLIISHFLLPKYMYNLNSDLKSVKQKNTHQVKYTSTVPFMQLIQLSYDNCYVNEKMSSQNVFNLLVRETTYCYYFLCAYLGFQNGARSRCHGNRAG